MAKLSHKISGNDNDKSNNKNVKLGFSLSTKVENNNINTPKTNPASKEEQFDEKIIETPVTVAKIIETIGLEKFGTLTKEDLLKLFPDENVIDKKTVKKEILAKVFTKAIDDELQKYVAEINEKYSKLLIKYKDNFEKLNKKNIQVNNLTAQVEDAEAQIFKTEKKFAESVPVEQLITNFIRKNITTEYTKRISDLLYETYKNDTSNGAKFIYAFLKGFVFIENTILQLGDDEKENINGLHNATKELMSEISELSVPERRPILDIVANMLNSYLQTYDFVSPEQTLQIDPTIHNVEGMGGTVVKEGLSFAVVRRETRKTVYYADIITK